MFKVPGEGIVKWDFNYNEFKQDEYYQISLANYLVGIEDEAYAIRKCESGDNYNITNGHGLSTSSGAYQFIDGTWKSTWINVIREDPPTQRAYQATPREQDRAFAALWDDGDGKRHWYPSRSCWISKINR
jgi:hypothetical protein